MHRWPWLLLYLACVAVKFFADWLEDIAKKRLKGEEDKPKDPPDEEE